MWISASPRVQKDRLFLAPSFWGCDCGALADSLVADAIDPNLGSISSCHCGEKLCPPKSVEPMTYEIILTALHKGMIPDMDCSDIRSVRVVLAALQQSADRFDSQEIEGSARLI